MMTSMDFYNIKRTKGRLSAFIMGLISSCFGLHFAIIVGTMDIFTTQTLGFSAFSSESTVAIGIIVLLLSVINVVGASLIRRFRIAGGMLMMASCIPLFSLAVIEPLNYMFFLVTGPVGIASAILAFIPLSDIYLKKLSDKQQLKQDIEKFIAYKKEELYYTKTFQVPEPENEEHQNQDW